MTTQAIADQLVSMIRSGRIDQCYDQLFAENAESIEMEGIPNNHIKGLENMKRKAAAWNAETKQVHSLEVSDPVIGGTYFSVSMSIDVEKNDGTRAASSEVCVYKTADGKIIEERFFYDM